jgi:hypothetical protein
MPQLRRSIAGFPTRRPGFEPRPGHVGFAVDKVALGQAFSEYSGFPCQFSCHRLLHIHHLSSEAGTIGQILADVSSELSLTSAHETKKNYIVLFTPSRVTFRRCPVRTSVDFWEFSSIHPKEGRDILKLVATTFLQMLTNSTFMLTF